MHMNKPENFEQALKRLEDIVRQLEQDELPLEDALKHYEQGVALSKYCAGYLEAAEKRIAELTRDEETGEPAIRPWQERN